MRAGDVDAVKRAIASDPAAVRTRVYAQAFERVEERNRYRNRTGLDPWDGKYIIHDAVAQIIDPPPMLDALAEGGADLTVRLNGRTLLHLAAQRGNFEVATWLLDHHAADPNAANDCAAHWPQSHSRMHLDPAGQSTNAPLRRLRTPASCNAVARRIDEAR